jgi:hypothetical protein
LGRSRILLADYLRWQTIDVRITKRINQLIADIKATPFAGLGKPEPLRHKWTATGRAELPASIDWSTASPATRRC